MARERPHEALTGRAAVPRGASGGRTATTAVACCDHPEGSRALSGVAVIHYDPWGDQGPLRGAGAAYGLRATAKMNNQVPIIHTTSHSAKMYNYHF